MYPLSIILAAFFLFMQPTALMAKNSQPSAAYEELTEILAAKTPLAGAVIQLSSSGFLEQNSRQELPFSAVLAEGFGAALSSRGVRVSVREQGENPLRLLGTYRLEKNQLRISVRIRQMGKSSSNDLAVAQLMVDRDQLQEGWFTADLATLADSLVRELENSLSGFDDPVVTVEQPRPGIAGQPTLQFGTELRKQLEQVISHSELLGGSSFGVKRTPYRLQSFYSRLAGSMRVELRLLGPDAKTAAIARAEISGQQIPAVLFNLVDDRGLVVCLQYQQRDRRDIREHSTQADALLDSISAALARFGTQSVVCDKENDVPGKRIAASMRLREKTTRDGYGLLRGDLQLTILDGEGRVVSTLDAKGKIPVAGAGDSSVERLITKMFDDGFQKELTALLLSR